MDLEIRSLWSPDLTASNSVPVDVTDYRLLVELSLSEKGHGGQEVFMLTVCSPSQLRAEDGAFVAQTLVLSEFSRDGLRARLQKLLMQTSSCQTWDEVIARLNPFLHASDSD